MKHTAVYYTGIGLALASAKDLATKLNTEPYAFDQDGKEEFEADLQDLNQKLVDIYNEYVSLKEVFIKRVA